MTKPKPPKKTIDHLSTTAPLGVTRPKMFGDDLNRCSHVYCHGLVVFAYQSFVPQEMLNIPVWHRLIKWRIKQHEMILVISSLATNITKALVTKQCPQCSYFSKYRGNISIVHCDTTLKCDHCDK